MDISYITNFILGGFLISSISWIALRFNSLLAAIWWSFPFTLIPSLIIAHSKGKSNAFLSRFMYGALYAAILLFISIAALSYFFKHTKEGITYPILKASFVWLICSILYYIIVKYFGLEKYFILQQPR